MWFGITILLYVCFFPFVRLLAYSSKLEYNTHLLTYEYEITQHEKSIKSQSQTKKKKGAFSDFVTISLKWSRGYELAPNDENHSKVHSSRESLTIFCLLLSHAATSIGYNETNQVHSMENDKIQPLESHKTVKCHELSLSPGKHLWNVAHNKRCKVDFKSIKWLTNPYQMVVLRARST